MFTSRSGAGTGNGCTSTRWNLSHAGARGRVSGGLGAAGASTHCCADCEGAPSAPRADCRTHRPSARAQGAARARLRQQLPHARSRGRCTRWTISSVTRSPIGWRWGRVPGRRSSPCKPCPRSRRRSRRRGLRKRRAFRCTPAPRLSRTRAASSSGSPAGPEACRAVMGEKAQTRVRDRDRTLPALRREARSDREHRAAGADRAVQTRPDMCKSPCSSSHGAIQIRTTRAGVRNGIAPVFISGSAGRDAGPARVASVARDCSAVPPLSSLSRCALTFGDEEYWAFHPYRRRSLIAELGVDF